MFRQALPPFLLLSWSLCLASSFTTLPVRTSSSMYVLIAGCLIDSIVKSEKDFGAAILVAKIYMHREAWIFSKCLSTLLPIILSDSLQFLMPGPDRNKSRQKFKLFKSRRESMRVHEC